MRASDEYRVLGLLSTRVYWARFSKELSEEFFSPMASYIFEAIGKWFFQNRGGPKQKVPAASVRLIIQTEFQLTEEEEEALPNALKKFRHYRRTLDENTVLLMLTQYCQERILSRSTAKALSQLQRGEIPLEQLEEALERASKIDFTSIGEGREALESELSLEEIRGVEKPAPTLIQSLDRALKGGLYPGELGVIGAQPNVGKTSFLINFAVASIITGLNVGYFTLEIGERKVITRVYERIMGEPLEIIQSSREEQKRLRSRLRKLKKRASFTIFDYTDQLTSPRVLKKDAEVWNASHEGEFGILFCDFADLLSPERGYQAYRFELRDIYRTLRQTARSLGIPLWTASQIKKGAGGKRVFGLEDLTESYEGKAGVPDTVITLNQTPEEKEDNLLRVKVAKSRWTGRRGIVKVSFYPDSNLVKEFEGWHG